MDKKVIFIHPSEILAKGFYSILNSNLNMDLIHMNSISEIDNYCDIEDSFILFIVDTLLKENVCLLETVYKENTSELMWFNNCDPGGEDTFYAFSSVTEVLSKVEKVLIKHNLQEEESVIVKDLSDREIDVLRLVASGFANREIAEKLFISIHTVISHRKNITEKLGIKSISGLTVYAILNKLIEPEELV